jgi:hypothetical protein
VAKPFLDLAHPDGPHSDDLINLVVAGQILLWPTGTGPRFLWDLTKLQEQLSSGKWGVQKDRLVAQRGQFGFAGGVGKASEGMQEISDKLVAYTQGLLSDEGSVASQYNVIGVWSPAYPAHTGAQEAHSDTPLDVLRVVFGITTTGAPRQLKIAGEGVVPTTLVVPSGGAYAMSDVGKGARIGWQVQKAKDGTRSAATHEPLAGEVESLVLIVDMAIPATQQADAMDAMRANLAKEAAALPVDQRVGVAFAALPATIDFDTQVLDRLGDGVAASLGYYRKLVAAGKLTETDPPRTEVQQKSIADSFAGGFRSKSCCFSPCSFSFFPLFLFSFLFLSFFLSPSALALFEQP